MVERKYSVAEIDLMRKLVRLELFVSLPSGIYSFDPNEDIESRTEDRLRTYMINGTEPKEMRRFEEHTTLEAALALLRR